MSSMVSLSGGACVLPTATDREKAVKEVMDCERRRCNALVARDFEELRRLVAREITHTHTRGVTDDYDQYFDLVENRLRFLKVTRGDLLVRIFDDVAVMTGPMSNLVQPVGQSDPIEVHSQVLQVWSRRGDVWTQVAFQSTTLPA